jgi:hypothetical protein
LSLNSNTPHRKPLKPMRFRILPGLGVFNI